MKQILNYLDRYLAICASVIPALNVEEAKRLALAATKYYQGNQLARQELSKGQALEQRWYESLANGEPDYGVYDDDFFVSDLWACWVVYSRGYVKAIRKLAEKGLLPEIASVADLGCGAGYTTAALQEVWPAARVIGTNLPRTAQYRIAESIGAEHGFFMSPSIGRPVDLVFASEYFEHFQRPIEHLRDVIRFGSPRYLVVANSFGSRSIGHFNTYYDAETPYSNKTIGRAFNKLLRDRRYQRVQTGFWNNRPAVWKRTD
jgi:hypothetical protein